MKALYSLYIAYVSKKSAQKIYPWPIRDPGKLTGIRIWKQSQNKRSSHNLARWVAGISVKIMAGLFF